MSDTSNQGNAGAPVRHDTASAAARPAGGTRPSAAELDERERQKAQPRRPGGPPLAGGPGAAAAAATPHRPDPSSATDPKE